MEPFRPTKPARPQRIMRNVKLEVTPERYDHLKGLADAAGITLKEFIRQAVAYAVDRHEIVGKDR
jgi:hypothetical protein